MVIQDNKHINIAFAINEGYIPYLATTITSIIENKKSKETIHVYVLFTDIKKESRENIKKKFSEYMDLIIDFVDVNNMISEVDFFVAGSKGEAYISKETYYRLLIPYLLPELSQIIYLDADVYVNCDLGELAHKELNNVYLAAVPDIADNWKYIEDGKEKKYRESELGISNQLDYFNAGVEVMNLQMFRLEYSLKDLLEMAASQEWHKHDQDVLNKIAHNKYLKLDIQWNLIEILPDQYEQITNNDIKKRYKDALANPKIIHYATRKPWKKTESFFSDYFWKAACQTEYLNLIINDLIYESCIDEEKLIGLCYDSLQKKKIGGRFVKKIVLRWLKIFWSGQKWKKI